MPKALITGISGQDGSYLSEQLVAAGYDVHGLVRDASLEADETRSRTPTVTLHQGDLAEPDGIAQVVRDIEPDEIYNLAGISSVAYSWAHPLETAQLTGLAVTAILQAALELSDKRGRAVSFVQASSSEIFGNPDRSPQDESTGIRPLSPYGAAKAYGHMMTGIYRARGLRASTVILYNHESPRRPEKFVTRKITAGVARIALGLQDSLSLGDISVRRDWGWAPDFTRAMALAAGSEEPGDFVIGTGSTHSVEEFVAAAFEAAGIDDWRDRVKIDPQYLRPQDVAEMRADATLARKILGWEPTVGFAEIVAEMVKSDLEQFSGS
jgi:GDPmannose 4,6-dehydratase